MIDNGVEVQMEPDEKLSDIILELKKRGISSRIIKLNKAVIRFRLDNGVKLKVIEQHKGDTTEYGLKLLMAHLKDIVFE